MQLNARPFLRFLGFPIIYYYYFIEKYYLYYSHITQRFERVMSKLYADAIE